MLPNAFPEHTYFALRTNANRPGALTLGLLEHSEYMQRSVRFVSPNQRIYARVLAANHPKHREELAGVAQIMDFGNTDLREFTLKFTATQKSCLSLRWAVSGIFHNSTGMPDSKSEKRKSNRRQS